MAPMAGMRQEHHEPVVDEDGSMRMLPGWTIVQRHVEVIGAPMPYARGRTRLMVDDEDPNLLWSEKNDISPQIVVSIDQLPSPSEPEPLPLLTNKSMRAFVQPNGDYSRNVNPKPCAVYQFEDGDDPRTRAGADGPEQKKEYAVEIFVPLFRAEKVESIEKRKINRNSPDGPPAKKQRRDDWNYGDWSLNDAQAGMWHAQHPGEQLIRFSDGRWGHPDFYEKQYNTSLDHSWSESQIARRDDLGLFSLDGNQYIWRLSRDSQNVQLYQGLMKKTQVWRRRNGV